MIVSLGVGQLPLLTTQQLQQQATERLRASHVFGST